MGVLGAAPPLPWGLGLLSVARYFTFCRFCVFSFYGVAQKNLNCGMWGREGRGSKCLGKEKVDSWPQPQFIRSVRGAGMLIHIPASEPEGSGSLGNWFAIFLLRVEERRDHLAPDFVFCYQSFEFTHPFLHLLCELELYETSPQSRRSVGGIERVTKCVP